MSSTNELITMSDEFLYRHGTQIAGVFKTNSEDMFCVKKSVLFELLDKSKRCDELEKRDSARIQAIMSGQQSASWGSSDVVDYAKYFSARSAEVRGAKKREADAIIVAYSVLGHSTYTIKKVLDERRLHGSSTKISKAISVSQPDDKERLKALMSDYPEIFENVSEEEFEKWYEKRLKKAERRNMKKSNEWGE